MEITVSFKREFGLILIGALIFTASFLWKDLISDVEEKYFPKNRGLIGRFFFVLLMTFILVGIAVLLKRRVSVLPSETIKFDDEPIDKDEKNNNNTDSVNNNNANNDNNFDAEIDNMIDHYNGTELFGVNRYRGGNYNIYSDLFN